MDSRDNPDWRMGGRQKMEGYGGDRGCRDHQVMDFEDATWFANLNSPEEFAEAEEHLDALDKLDGAMG